MTLLYQRGVWLPDSGEPGHGTRILRALPRVVAYDSFDRANNATTLGSADTGQPWTAQNGVWGISSGRAYCPSGAGACIATLDAGLTHVMVEATVVYLTLASKGIVARYADASNYLHADLASGAVRLVKTVAGSQTLVGSAAVSVADDGQYQLRLVARGPAVAVFFNGQRLVTGTVTDAALQTATLVGMRSTSGTLRRLDTFIARRAG